MWKIAILERRKSSGEVVVDQESMRRSVRKIRSWRLGMLTWDNLAMARKLEDPRGLLGGAGRLEWGRRALNRVGALSTHG
jgi:hypothetical protein